MIFIISLTLLLRVKRRMRQACKYNSKLGELLSVILGVGVELLLTLPVIVHLLEDEVIIVVVVRITGSINRFVKQHLIL